MKQSVACVFQLGQSVSQTFHSNFLDEKGEVLLKYLEFAKKAHDEIHHIQKCLDMDQNLINDDEVWTALQSLRPWKERRKIGVEESLKRLSDGTFTFTCEERCSCHPNCGGECNAYLHDEKMVMPEAINCAKFRTYKECNTPMRTES